MDTATTRLSGLTIESAGADEAVYDDHRVYRYRLTRTWDRQAPGVCWVMLNPSTATATDNDPTINRVVGFSRTWGYGSAAVVNLFALRSSQPAEVAKSSNPVGPYNDEIVRDAVSHTSAVVVAWGNHGSIANPATGIARDREIEQALDGSDPICLGKTRWNRPRHPLYLPANTRPVPFVRGTGRVGV